MSNYVQTGEGRRTILQVSKTDADGNTVSGYPVQYNILSAFTDPVSSINYAAITSTDYARLTSTQFNARLAAFVNYVKSLHAGIENDIASLSSGCYVAESPTCVVNVIVPGGETT
jgi:hypothetical protein